MCINTNIEKTLDQKTEIEVDKISLNTISSVFNEREKYIIIALTGKVGSGCTLVSDILKHPFPEMKLMCESPNESGFCEDSQRAARILWRFYNEHHPNFHVIRVSDVITSFLLEKNAWNRINDYSKDAISDFINKIEKNETIKNHSACQGGTIDNIVEKLKTYNSQVFGDESKNKFTRFEETENSEAVEETENSKAVEETENSEAVEETENSKAVEETENSKAVEETENSEAVEETIPKQTDPIDTKYESNSQTLSEKSETYIYIKYILPLLSECIRNRMAENYTHIYQEFGNELRFFGTLDPEIRESNLKNSVNIRKSTDGKDTEKNDISSQNTIFTIAKRINQTIKYLQRPKDINSKEPIAVVIDSMKNMYESNYLRDRYSAYYLLSISRDEEIRNKSLLSDQRKKFTQDDIDKIDLNERPAVASKKLLNFTKCFINDIGNDDKKLKEYLDAINQKDFKKLFNISLESKEREEIQKEFEEINRKDIDFIDGNTGELKSNYKDKGLTIGLCKYYYSILTDTLRVFLYLNDLYPFYLQDVETCIQNADILLTNNEDDAGPKHKLKMNLIRYVSLMMHPGLVKPTQIERCMQIAYTAKVNSGCISRQVGAVVTDKDYNILSLGWNDVPCGQTPCAYRNLIDLSRQFDKPAYSDYEWRKDSDFHLLLDKYDFSKSGDNKNVLNGLPASFCFKKLNEDVTGEKNPMNARSMHGEEKALLQCDQQRVKGGYLFTTSSPCEMCAKNAKEHQISKIYYIEPYPGISQSHICNSGDNRANLILFEGAIGRAYTQLYTPILPYKDELSVRGFPNKFKRQNT